MFFSDIKRDIDINIFAVAGGSGDAAGAAGGPPPVLSSGRGSARGKRILPADIFVTKPSHIKDKKGIYIYFLLFLNLLLLFFLENC